MKDKLINGSNKRVVILDYGVGNIFSVESAIRHLGVDEVSVSAESNDIAKAHYLILPGVGAFADAMCKLSERKLIEPIINFAQSGKPILGICLGMQLLMSVSEEFGLHQGLDLIKGKVISFKSFDCATSYKLPHIGWGSLQIKNDDSILLGLQKKHYFYFVHSFIVVPNDRTVCIAYASCREVSFAAVIKENNIYGCQFHPEKSGRYGLEFLRNFLNQSVN